ncbi:MAG: hypothetical protein CYPHOPRED_003304 [Cyphobasidiales sp. Tagirdzhanova-0007]|nr:MAG: hypothetical protein CYPHOPRED_003304 [Cyphobasidiales sp. Tagirdzhanova-0007]
MKDVFFSMAVLLGAVMVSKALPLNRRQATTTTAAPLPGSTSGASGNVATVFSVWGPVANTTAGGNPSAPSLLPEETFYIPGGSSTGLGGSNTTIYGYLMETFTSDASDVAQTVTITDVNIVGPSTYIEYEYGEVNNGEANATELATEIAVLSCSLSGDDGFCVQYELMGNETMDPISSSVSGIYFPLTAEITSVAVPSGVVDITEIGSLLAPTPAASPASSASGLASPTPATSIMAR